MLFQTKLIQSITKEVKKEMLVDIQTNGLNSKVKIKGGLSSKMTTADFRIINENESEFVAYVDDTKRRDLVELFNGRNEVTAITQNCEVRIKLNNTDLCASDVVNTLLIAEVPTK